MGRVSGMEISSPSREARFFFPRANFFVECHIPGLETSQSTKKKIQTTIREECNFVVGKKLLKRKAISMMSL